MDSDFKSWYLENSDFFEHLHSHNTILFSHIKDIIDSLAFISDMKESEIDSDLNSIFDTGYAYLYNYISILQSYLKNNFDGNFHKLLDYDIILNYNFYVNDLKEMFVEEGKYDSEIRNDFEYILSSIDDIIVNKKEFNEQTINEYNVIMLSVIPSDHDYLTVPEVFTNVIDKLKL